MEIILFLPVLFFSVVLHEFAHGFAAYRLGDDTAYLSGRLTLNPIQHVDPVGTLGVPLLCYVTGFPLFGWAKPVPVNPLRLASPRRDMGKVALAGPLTNFTLALVFLFSMKLLSLFPQIFSEGTLRTLVTFLNYGLFINIMLTVFNLMPIPPLDGGRILTAVLPFKAALVYERIIGRYGMWIVVGLVLTGWVKYLLLPPTMLIVSLFSKFLM